MALFLVSAEFEQGSVPASAKALLKSAGSPLWAANNILVLGSDARPAGSREPGAGGPSRSDSILLIRTGGGHAARLSIPRDMVVDIPGHGLQKINAAFAFGGPALTISVLENWLGIPINHVVEMSFTNFPKLIDAMGGINYTGGCVVSVISGGFKNGGFTLRLTPGSHHLNGQQALALARTRHNLCNPSESDLTREQRQQKIVLAIEHQLTDAGHLPAPAAGRLGRAAGDEQRHERGDAAEPRGRAEGGRLHADTAAGADRRDHAARRRVGPHDHRRRHARRRRALHARLRQRPSGSHAAPLRQFAFESVARAHPLCSPAEWPRPANQSAHAEPSSRVARASSARTWSTRSSSRAARWR